MRLGKKDFRERQNFSTPLKWGRKTVKEREKHYRKKKKRHKENSEIVAKVIPREKRNKRGKRH